MKRLLSLSTIFNCIIIATTLILAPVSQSIASTEQLNMIALFSSETIDTNNSIYRKLTGNIEHSLKDLKLVEEIISRKQLTMKDFSDQLAVGFKKINRRIVKKIERSNMTDKSIDHFLAEFSAKNIEKDTKAEIFLKDTESSSKEKLKDLVNYKLNQLENGLVNKLSKASTPSEFIQQLRVKAQESQTVCLKKAVKGHGRSIADNDGGLIAGTSFVTFYICILLICIVVLIFGPIGFVITTAFAMWVVGISAAIVLSVPTYFLLDELFDGF